MFLSVQELEVKKVRFEVAFPPGEIDFSDAGLTQATPLEAQGSAELLAHTLGEIRVRGHLKVRMRSECDRCLEPAEFPVDSSFDLFYRPAVEAAPAEDVEIDPGETEIGFYQGDGLELKDVLREYVLLAMPMQRVCREECQGFCPVCGQIAIWCSAAAKSNPGRPLGGAEKSSNQRILECLIQNDDTPSGALPLAGRMIPCARWGGRSVLIVMSPSCRIAPARTAAATRDAK